MRSYRRGPSVSASLVRAGRSRSQSGQSQRFRRRHEWACFQAQQAGEKALKALLYGRGIPAILTHSLRRLIRECEAFDETFRALGEAARLLDQHYISTRFPTYFDSELPPTRYYEEGDADACLQSAHAILERVRPLLRVWTRVHD